MYWNYRAVKDKHGVHLCEVYYDSKGVPNSRTDAIQFENYQDLDELIKSLEMALSDVKKSPLLNQSDINGEPYCAGDMIDGYEFDLDDEEDLVSLADVLCIPEETSNEDLMSTVKDILELFQRTGNVNTAIIDRLQKNYNELNSGD